MKQPTLQIKNLTKYYGKIKGVENLSLQLYAGEIFGFIGPNGAGKSTTIRCIMHLINPTSGQILINDKEFKQDDTETKSIIGYLPSEIHLYDDLTVKEMLNYHEGFYKKDIHKRRCELTARFQLDETKRIEDLSLGNLKKLGIILAFMHEPKILILDEPTSGLDPIMQNVFYDLLKEERAKGNLILYSTHILSEISKICDRVGIIKNGRLIKLEEIHTDKSQSTSLVITSPQINEIIRDIEAIVHSQDNTTASLQCELPHDILIKKLAQYSVEHIQIKQPSPEEMFFRYYEQENETC